MFTEVETLCASQDSFYERSPPSLNEFLGLRWSGSWGTCGGNTYAIWNFIRGSGYATYDFGIMVSSSADFRAFTEHFNNTHMEPNSVQCFGRGSGCATTAGTELRVYNRSSFSWGLWDTSKPTTVSVSPPSSGYSYNYIVSYSSFFTGGIW